MDRPRPRRRRSAATDLELGGAQGEARGEALGGVPVSVLVRCRPALEQPAVRVSAEAKGPGRLALHLDPGEAPSQREREPSYARERGRTLEPRTFRCNGFCGECSSQEDVFAHAQPVVDRVMEGYNGTIFCYGITGSGKSYTMSGPPADEREADASQSTGASHGIVQRSARRIFEFIRDHSEQGEVFSVEASFLEVYSHDGMSEALLDLLADGGKHDTKLEIHQDPLNKQAFVCEGLTRVPISSPDEMCNVLDTGRRQCQFMETTRNCHSSRSHCLFLVNVERLAEQQSGEPNVRRGKLVLVDLAGSESLKKVVAANDDDETLRRRQAIGINRVLSHLGTVVNNLNAGHSNSLGYRNSALTMLLRDCLGGAASALLVANIGPEAEWCSETFMTLTFAQKMMQVRNVEKQTVVDKSQSTLLQMKERHLECIKRLKESAPVDGQENNSEEMLQLQKEVKELNTRLLTKRNVTETLERLQAEQKQKMDELRSEMTQTITSQLETLQEHSVREFADLREVIETKTREGGEIVQRQWRAASEAQLQSLQDTLTAACQRQKMASDEKAQLRLQLTAAEERVQMLQDLQQDLIRTREELDQERQAIGRQSQEQQERLLSLDRQVNRYRVEAEVLQGQVEQQRAVCAEDAAAAHAEREAWAAREAELRAARQSVRERLDAELQRARTVTRDTAAHRAAVDELRGRVAQLEAEAGVQERQLEGARQARLRLEDAVFEAQEREADLQQQLVDEEGMYLEEVDSRTRSIAELNEMLDEVQGSIMRATKRELVR